jgi:hypothetical protein
MLATEEVPELREIIWRLREKKQPRLMLVIERLNATRTRCKAATILKELAPEKLKRLKGEKFSVDQAENDGWTDLFQTCLAEINHIAPLDEDCLNNMMDGGDGSLYKLFPACAGYPLGWDEWGELAEDPQDCAESMRLFLFANIWRLEGAEKMEEASEMFDWGVDVEKGINFEDVIWERFEHWLKRNGLGVFVNALNACLYQTGNVYFDWNPWGESVDDSWLPNFSVEGVRKLEKAWQEAQPILADLNAAIELFTKEPGLGGKLMEMAARCGQERVRIGPRRLVIFSGKRSSI